MTDNKDLAWLDSILLKVQNSGIDFANNPRSPASVALAEAKAAIATKLQQVELEARIDELEKTISKTSSSGRITQDKLRQRIYYLRYLKPRPYGAGLIESCKHVQDRLDEPSKEQGEVEQ